MHRPCKDQVLKEMNRTKAKRIRKAAKTHSIFLDYHIKV